MFTIRRLVPDDWALFRDIRLEALTLDADKFGRSVAVEKAYTDQDWYAWLATKDKFAWGLFSDEIIIGMRGAVVWHKEVLDIQGSSSWPCDLAESSILFSATYVRREYRNRGLGGMLFRVSMNDVASSYKQALTAHRTSNEEIKYLIKAHGFILIESRPHEWPVGPNENIDIYQLDFAVYRRSAEFLSTAYESEKSLGVA